MDAYDGADRVFVRRGHPCASQLARPAALADPLRRRARLAVRIGHMDVAAETNNVTKTERCQVCEQLVVAKAAVGQDGDGAVRWHKFLQPGQAGVLEVVALLRQFVLPDAHP